MIYLPLVKTEIGLTDINFIIIMALVQLEIKIDMLELSFMGNV
jgi:hypothetical protein